MSIMAWYPLPQSGSTLSPGDEFFDSQSAGWSLWSFGSGSADDHDHGHDHSAGSVRAERHGNEQTGGSVPQQRAQPTYDIFMSQFSDEEMRKMDAPFEALDMFPDSMHRLLSYENMLSGVLTGSEDQDATLGVDTMDTCGFPLFSHDLQNGSRRAEPSSRPEIVPDLTPKDLQAGVRMAKRSRSIAGEESLFFEALVLQELEDVVLQLTKRTRICFRDAFFRLAEGSRAKCSGAPSSSSQTVVQQAEGNAIRMSAPGFQERETNAIDRTVADLTMKPPCPVSPQVHVSRCCTGDPGAEAQSATSWTTTA